MYYKYAPMNIYTIFPVTLYFAHLTHKLRDNDHKRTGTYTILDSNMQQDKKKINKNVQQFANDKIRKELHNTIP